MNDQRSNVAHMQPTIGSPAWAGPAGPIQARPQGLDTSAEVGDLWRILSRRRRIIAVTVAVFVTAALLYGFLTPPLYTATAQLLLDPRDRQVVTNDLNASTLAPDGGVTQVESQVKVLQSNAVLLRAIARAGLVDDPEFGAPGQGPMARWRRALATALLGPTARDPEADALAGMRRRLAVKRADKVFVIDVVVTTSGADTSARIANAIADAYLADQADARVQAAGRASGELRARLDGLRRDVAAAESRLDAYKAENGLIASSGRIVNEQQLSDSDVRLVAAQARTAEAKSRLQQVRDLRGNILGKASTPEAVSSIVVERLRAQYAELSSKEADLRMSLGARHPSMLAAEAQRADIKGLIDAELDRIAQSTETDYRRALANEATLRGSFDALREGSVRTSRASARMRELEQDVEANRTVYNNFLLRSREISEQANVDPTNARIIGAAIPPTEPSWPQRGVILLVAAVGGLSVGAGLAMGREYWRPTVLSGAQLERLLGVPVLGTLPLSKGVLGDAAAVPAALALDGLRCLPGPDTGGRSIMVTAAAADGPLRRDVVDLLAAVATSCGERVLVIDADLAAAGGEDGLLEILRGQRTLGSVSAPDPHTGAAWIGVGRAGGTPRDAFTRETVGRLLAAVDGAFDLAIIDGGSLAHNLGAGPLARAVDQLIAVSAAGTTAQADVITLGKVAGVLGRRIDAALLAGGEGA